MPSQNLAKLEILQIAKELNTVSYPLLRRIPDFTYRDQMTRSCLSIASNIAEGYGRRRPNVFALFIDYAMGSVFEFQTQLELAERNGLVASQSAAPLYDMLDMLIPMLINFEKSLPKSTNNKPPSTNS